MYCFYCNCLQKYIRAASQSNDTWVQPVRFLTAAREKKTGQPPSQTVRVPRGRWIRGLSKPAESRRFLVGSSRQVGVALQVSSPKEGRESWLEKIRVAGKGNEQPGKLPYLSTYVFLAKPKGP